MTDPTNPTDTNNKENNMDNHPIPNVPSQDPPPLMASNPADQRVTTKEVAAMSNTPNTPNTTNEKEDKLYIYETHIGLGDGNTIWAQVVTNCPNQGELTLYNRLMELRQDNHILAAEMKLKKETGRAFRINSIGANYRFLLLQDRINRYGYGFRLEFIKLKERDENGVVQDIITEEMIPYMTKRIMNSTRSWSTSTSTNIIFLKDAQGKLITWDNFDPMLDMLTGNNRKQSKREAENSRTTQLGFEVDVNQFSIHIPYRETDLHDAATDGHFVISYNCFLEAVRHMPKEFQAKTIHAYEKGEMLSFNGRVMGWWGLIKGDCHVVPNKQLKAKYGYVPDIVTDMVNIKPEKGMLGGTVSVSLTAHHPHHLPNVSTQLLSWGLGFFVTKERLENDFTAMVNEFVTTVAKGEFPKHLMKAAPVHNDDDELIELSYINSLHDATHRWLSSGMTLRHSSHLVKQHAGGFKAKMIKAITDLRLPMPWSTMAHCVTVAVLEMGGWDLSEYDTSKMFWHAPTGRMCWPTQDFIDNYNRHGGHDLDDTHTTSLRMTSDGHLKAINTRSPNGLSYFGENEAPGEYSILDIDLYPQIVQFGFLALPTINFPLYNVYDEIPELDMELAPKVTHHQEIEHQDLPRDDYELGPVYSPEDAVRQFKLAMANPGIGQIINPLIAYSATLGTYPKNLAAYLEQMVDALEQTPDFEAFQVIMEAKASIINALIHHTNRKVDHYIAYKRLGKDVVKQLKEKGRIDREGPYKKLNDHMKAILQQAMEILVGDGNPNKAIATKGINITGREIITDLLDIEVTLDAKRVAHQLIKDFGGLRKGAPKVREDQDRATGLYLKKNDPYVSYAVRQFFIALNSDIVRRIEDSEVDNDSILIAIYQIIIEKNLEDDILFQTGDVNTLDGVMDMFLMTLFKVGVIEKVMDPEGIETMNVLG